MWCGVMRLLVTVFNNDSDSIIEEIDVISIGYEAAADLVGEPIENLVYAQSLTLISWRLSAARQE